jgi:hypothetical protein
LPAPPPPSQRVINLLPFATIVQASGTTAPIFRCWFNIDAPNNRATVLRFPLTALKVLAENTTAPSFLTQLSITAVNLVAGARNLFDVRLEKTGGLLRFLFDLSAITVQVDAVQFDLLGYMDRFGMNFEGFDGKSIVTVFAPLGTVNLG